MVKRNMRGDWQTEGRAINQERGREEKKKRKEEKVLEGRPTETSERCDKIRRWIFVRLRQTDWGEGENEKGVHDRRLE